MLRYGRPSGEHKAGMLIWGGREGGWEEAVRGGGRNIYIMRGAGPAARVTVSQKSAPPKGPKDQNRRWSSGHPKKAGEGDDAMEGATEWDDM